MGSPANRTSRQKQIALLLALSATPLTGCASMKSPMSWFSKSDTSVATSTTSPGWTQSLTSTGKGIGNQFKTMGTTMTSAVGKAKNAVVSTFTQKTDGETDPQTSLAQMPSTLGPEIWVTNGQVYEMRGEYAKALDNYTKALEKEPDNLSALQSVARLQLRQQQYTESIDTYQRVVRVSPTADNYAELGAAQQSAGKLTEAQASIQQAITLDPNAARYRNNLAGVLVAMGRSDEAVKELQHVFPPAVANYNVAYLHMMNKNLPATQQHLQLALQADPNLQPARDLMSKLTAGQLGQTAMATYDAASQIYQSTHATGTTAAQSTPAIPVSSTSTTPGTAAAQFSALPQLPTVTR